MAVCAAAGCAAQALLDGPQDLSIPAKAAAKHVEDANCYVLLDGCSDEQSRTERSKASLFSISANLVMSGLGAGILSLPWAMAGASIIPSVLTIMLVMALNAGTIMILVLAAERHQVFDLGSLLAHLPSPFGPALQWLNNSLTWFSVFLTLVGYIVVMADSTEPFVVEALGLPLHGPADTFWTVRAPILAACCLVVLPICFVDQQRLAVSSVVGICVTVYLFVVVALLYAKWGVADECCMASALHEGTLTMFSTLMQCVIIQMCILPMYEELENRSPRRFGVAVVSAFGFLAVLFAAFSAVAYTVFGPTVSSNVMFELPHDGLGSAARIGMTLVMLAVFPIMMVSMVAPIRHWEATTGRTQGYVSIIVSVLIVVASAVAAAFVSKLGSLNAMNGSLQVSCFIGLAPGVAGLYLLESKGWLWNLCMYVLIILSATVSLVGLVYTDNAVDQINNDCLWTIAD